MAPPASTRRALVVDDDETVRSAITRYLQRTGYEAVAAKSGEEALERLKAERFVAMVCDIRMPGLSGLDLLPQAMARDPDLAVLMLTGVGDPGAAVKCLKLGAADYLLKPVELEELQLALASALRRRELEIERREMQQWLEREVADKTRDLREQSRQVELLTLSVLTVLVDAAEPRGANERTHSLRVSNLSAHVAAELGLVPSQIETVRMAARLHDLGRIVSRDALRVSLPGAVNGERTPSEMDAAARILEPLRQHAGVADAIRHQHERWDGGGPLKRKGEAIPVGARVIAAVNQYDELTDGTSETRGGVIDAARRKLRDDAGTALDPAVVGALDRVLDRRD